MIEPFERRQVRSGVISYGVSSYGYDMRVAREFRTLLITGDGPSDEVFKRSDPFLFSIGTSDSRLIRNMVHWAEQRGVRMRRGRLHGLRTSPRCSMPRRLMGMASKPNSKPSRLSA